MTRESDVLTGAIVVNLLDGTILPRHMPGFPIEKYLPLLLEGGVTAFVTTVAAHHEDDFSTAVARLIHWRRLVEANPSALRLILMPNDLVAAKQGGQVGVIFGFQDPKPIGEDLVLLGALYHLGLRVLQLTYQRRTLVGDGCGESANGGLSAFGRLLVWECNRLGVLVDLAHAGYRTTLDAIVTSEVPVLISHTGSYTLCPHVRNIHDDQLRAIAENGGVVGVYAISQFIRQDGGEKGADITDVVAHIEYKHHSE
jgi:membrane dipeptidase